MINENKSYVYLYRHENYVDLEIKSSLIDILSSTHVIEKIENSNTRLSIFIKLNLVGPFSPNQAITTNPHILDLILEILKEKDINNILDITVGDNPAIREEIFTMKKTGIYDIVKKHNVNIMDASKISKITCPDYKLYRDFEVSAEMIDADIFINLPKVKTHTLAYITVAQKNLFGLIYGLDKSAWHAKASNPLDFAKAFNDLYLAFLNARKDKLTLHIADGIEGLEGDGPSTGGIKKEGKFIIASLDAISLDRVSIEILKLDYNKSILTLEAAKRNIGEANLKNIIINNDLNNFRDIKFKEPNNSMPNIGLRFMKIKFVKSMLFEHPKADSEKCIKCGECYKICPPKAITFEKGKVPKINRTKCIRCWCCSEVCPKNAMGKTKRPLVGRIFLR